jgi:hypothetical protein
LAQSALDISAIEGPTAQNSNIYNDNFAMEYGMHTSRTRKEDAKRAYRNQKTSHSRNKAVPDFSKSYVVMPNLADTSSNDIDRTVRVHTYIDEDSKEDITDPRTQMLKDLFTSYDDTSFIGPQDDRMRAMNKSPFASSNDGGERHQNASARPRRSKSINSFINSHRNPLDYDGLSQDEVV